MMHFDSSIRLFDRARRLMPGGVSSPVRAISPYPFYTARAIGPYLWDCDGNRFIDYCLAYGPMILGHRHPAIKEAVSDQMDRGWLYGTPSELEVRLAERVSSLYPSMERLRFVSSGTEATMAAIRVARGSTGRDMIIKIEGGFHGAHDSVLVKAGSGATTLGIPDSRGVPRDATKNTIQVPYNDPAALEEVLERFSGRIACLIMEPVLGNIGPILPDKGYLQTARRLTKKNDVLLIFDEVITGFRLSLGGAQELYGVRPDLTVMGKVLGGGMPMGAFGGPREIMSRISPLGKVYQAGTYSGNPMSLSAALATLDVLESQGLEGLNGTGSMVRDRLTRMLRATGEKAIVQGEGSMFQVFFGEGPLRNAREVLACDRSRYMALYRRMLELGVSMPPSQFETCFLSLAHGKEATDGLLSAFAEALEGSP